MKATLYGLTKNKNDIHVKSQLEKMLAQVSADGAAVIDGVNIAAESIYGKSIVAGSIEAAQIKAGAITSGHITTNGIVADKIRTGILRSENGASWLNLNDGTFSYANGNFTFQDGKMVVRAHTIELGGEEVPTKTQTEEYADKLGETLQDKIEGIEVGGRNLLKNSKNFKYTSINGGWVTYTSKNGQHDYTIKSDHASGQYGWFEINNSNLAEPIINNKNGNITIGLDYKGTVGFKYNFSLRTTSNTYPFGDSITKSLEPSSDWKRAYISIPFPQDSHERGRIYVFITPLPGTVVGDTFSVRNWKVEKGNVATDWTEAPEDVELEQNKKVYNPVRYIRDWLNGSSSNTGNHWCEIMANDTNGTNVAKGKTVATSGTASNLNYVTDGLTNSSYASPGAGKHYVEVDLGSVHYNIASVSIWHYYTDNRTYYETRTEVSEDRINWYPVFDSLTEGTYAETENGKTYPNTRARAEALIGAYNMSQQLATSTSKVVVNGGNITAGTVKSANSDSWINLDNGQFSFGKGNMVWNGSNLTVKGNIDAASINTGTLATSRIPDLSADKITVGSIKDKNSRNNINLDTGTFSLANGNIAYNGSKLEIKSGVSFSALDSDAQTKIDNGAAAKTKLDSKESLWDAKLTDAQVAAKILSDKKIMDTRTTNQNPAWYYTNYPNQIVREFKGVSVMGVGAGTFGILTTDVPWSGSSGGSVKQTFRTNTEEFKRDGTTTSWTAWVNHDAMAVGAKTLTDKWAFTGKTTINGGQIEADTITATQIDVANLSALSANLGNVTAGTITSTNGLIDINLNTGVINLGQPLTIKSKPVATKEDVDSISVGGRNLLVSGTLNRLSNQMTEKTTKKLKGYGEYYFDFGTSFIPNTEYTVSNSNILNDSTIYPNSISLTLYDVSGSSIRLIIGAMTSGSSVTFKTPPTTSETDRLFFYVSMEARVNFEIDELKLEKGNVATDWTEAPEDVQEQIVAIETRVSNAELSITPESITATVVESEDLTSKLKGYATQESLGGYISSDDFTTEKDNMIGEIDSRIGAIDYSPFVQTSELEQKTNAITAKFSQAGGVNLIQNSIGWAGKDFWSDFSATAGVSIQNDELSSMGFGSGWYSSASGYFLQKQRLTLPRAGTYTLSFWLKKTAGSSWAFVQVQKGADTTFANANAFAYTGYQGAKNHDAYELYSTTFEATELDVAVSININTGVEATITGIMLHEGSEPFKWQPYTSEVYNTNVKMDINGITVKNNQDAGYTLITPDEFSGYAPVDGTVERVFTLNGDTTEVKKLKAEQQFQMAPVTIITIDNSKYSGWAFI